MLFRSPIGGRTEEAAGLFAEIEQDGARIEHPRLAPARPLRVDDRRRLAVRIDGAKGGRVLFALGRIDRNGFIRQAELLEQQRDLHRIRRGVEIEADQGALQRQGDLGLGKGHALLRHAIGSLPDTGSARDELVG